MKVCQTCRRCYEDDAVRCVDSTHSPPLEEVRVPLELGGRWRIERLVSGTDWAAEFVGRHIELGRAVSIRVSTAEGPPDVWLKRARLAARSLAGVRNEHVARLEDFGSIPAGGAYAAVERFGDESVREAIERVGPLPAADAVRIGRQVAEGLAALAAKAIAPTPRALLAEEIRIGRDESLAPLATVTSFPDRDRGDPSQLVPALGGLLTEMLLGKPFTAGAFGNPEPISLARHDLPEELAALVDRSVSRSPKTAPKSIAEMAAGLRDIEASLGKETSAPSPAAPLPAPAFPSEPGPESFFRPGPSGTRPAAAFPPPPSREAELPPAPEEPPAPARPETVAIPTGPPPRTSQPATSAPPAPPSRNTPPPPSSRARAVPPPSVELPAPAAVSEKRERVPPRLDDMPLDPEENLDGMDDSSAPRRFPGGVVSTLLAALAVATAAAVWFIIETMPAHRPAGSPAPTVMTPRGAPEPTAAAAAEPTAVPPEATPTATAAAPAAALRLRPTPSDPSQRAVRAALDAWVSSTNSRNLSEQMRSYMPRLTVFYQQRNVSRDLVRRVKSELFALGPATIQMGDPEITVTKDRRAATTRFRKDYDVGSTRGRRRGAVLQELKWVHSDQGWKIVSERDAKVLE
ncbi:MAG: hypothetical protein M3167_14010 [Acidobacteriota bacterium]|nr:hypothetical protein [Acidobacteriota bacterium]